MKWFQIKYKLKQFIIKTNLFKHNFNVEGFIYVNIYGEPVNAMTGEVRWLGTVDIHCRYKDMDEKAIEAFCHLYPKYKGYINLY